MLSPDEAGVALIVFDDVMRSFAARRASVTRPAPERDPACALAPRLVAGA